jgi:hypothetical protein
MVAAEKEFIEAYMMETVSEDLFIIKFDGVTLRLDINRGTYDIIL